MPTESQFTRKLLTALRARMPQAIVLKFNDRSTSGIPDFCVVLNGKTSWFEVKHNNSRPYEPLQYEFLRRMRGHYIIVNDGLAICFVPSLAYSIRISHAVTMSFEELINNILEIAS